MAVANANAERGLEQLLRTISVRIRGIRQQRGLTRRQLAGRAGVSERYLAQLENGEANPSFVLLWRVARAMNTDFAALLAQPMPEGPGGRGDRPGNDARMAIPTGNGTIPRNYSAYPGAPT